MSFGIIPGPIQRVVRQSNGPLAIVQDRDNFYWVINRLNGKHISQRFEGLEAAKREVSSLMFLHRPKEEAPTWTAPVDGRAAQERFDRWPER